MMTPLLTSIRIAPAMLLGKDPLPTPLHRGSRILSAQSKRTLHPPMALPEILAVQDTNLLQMGLQFLADSRGKHGSSILATLSMPHCDLQTLKTKVMNP